MMVVAPDGYLIAAEGLSLLDGPRERRFNYSEGNALEILQYTFDPSAWGRNFS